MIKENTYIGKIIEIDEGEISQVEIDCYMGNEQWEAIRVPTAIFKGRVEIKMGNYAAFKIREYERFVITEGRRPTKKEHQYLKQREAEHEAKLLKDFEQLDDELFTRPESL